MKSTRKWRAELSATLTTLRISTGVTKNTWSPRLRSDPLTARVVEEVRVGKESSDRVETVWDTVRRQQIEVEKTGEISVSPKSFQLVYDRLMAPGNAVGSSSPAPARTP